MRSSFLRVEVTDRMGQRLTEIKVNLFRIITGPSHHDFSLGKSRVGGRLIFCLKISEMVELRVDVTSASAIFKREYPGDRFHFVIESHVRWA
jgi:hypothetical protein